MPQRTLAIVKPDGVENRAVGRVIARIEEEGFRIVAMRLARLTRAEAEGFYAVHEGRPFFDDLVRFMTSGPVVLMCLERDDAIARWREIMGATDPAKAAPGTLRKQLATNIERNTVHGSDAEATAAFELGWFFRGSDLG
ncbi:MAG TPA: nucleoside-diphosphate kinase [Candidatus Polarisedimenticolaceae bacterium]|nr:nucleoside-diphosphate kinase [Candidatus Polarisedimenticolaceae bacterium]